MELKARSLTLATGLVLLDLLTHCWPSKENRSLLENVPVCVDFCSHIICIWLNYQSLLYHRPTKIRLEMCWLPLHTLPFFHLSCLHCAYYSGAQSYQKSQRKFREISDPTEKNSFKVVNINHRPSSSSLKKRHNCLKDQRLLLLVTVGTTEKTSLSAYSGYH